jgi:choline-glycine betaine transporter
MGSISSYGVEEPRKPIVIFWGVMMGSVAAVMLLAGGDDPSEALTGLQQITIVAALPFVVVMVGMCIALTKDLYADPMILRHKLASSVVTRSIRTGVSQHGGEAFDIVTLPNAVPGSGPEEGSLTSADATPAGTIRSNTEH